jgi:transcriptional regulator with XRE-family HTH domain
MYENVTHELQDKSARLLAVQADLKKALSEYPNQTMGVRKLADKMALSVKTLNRIIKGSHSPSYQTILKVYRYLKGTLNDRETVLKMPPILAECIKLENENFSITNEEANFSIDISFYLKSDSVFRSIYIETATGRLTKEKIGYEHGATGLKTLEYMLDLGVIQEFEPNIYTSSTNRASLDSETAHHLSRFLLDNKFSTEKCALKGENFFQVIFDGIDNYTYNELLKVDWKAKNERMDILRNAKRGPIKYWSISYTDTLEDSCILDENKEVLQ